jgi:hypothetical protein
MHDGIPGVRIEPDGECNYCKLHDRWELDNDQLHGETWLKRVYQEMRNKRVGEYDCVIGISGGADSSFLLMELVDNGLKPLAVHWNNTWNTTTADNNIRKLTEGLGVDLYQVGIQAWEYNDLCRSFLLASTPDADIPNDIALATSLYQACEMVDCKYLINGHSFRTEGSTPLGWTYMDGGYIEDVHRRFGKWSFKNYPNLTYDLFKKYIELGIQRIRPLWSMPYNKKEAIQRLEDRFGWRWYKAHHAENQYTLFVGAYLWRVKFGMDLRYIEFSALIRSGFKTKEQALKEIAKPPNYPVTLPMKVRTRLGMTKDEWDRMLELPVKSHRDYLTYHERFKDDLDYFTLAREKDLIPETFFRKYVLGVQ